MHDVIQRIFAHTGGLDGMVEIGFTDARKGLEPPHPLNSGRKFRLADLDEAVEFAAKQNANQNCNVYFSAGICHVGAYEFSRAADTNIHYVAACWVDLDAPGSLANAINIAESMALRPNLVTFTGNDPTPRGQMWWVFDEPTADLDLHRRLQMALASKFNSDPSVINPSRVMRLAGGVAWPIKAGRSLEMTGLVDDAATRPAPYAIEEFVTKMERFGGMGPAQAKAERAPRVSTGDNVLDFSRAAATHDVAGLIAGAALPNQWHRHALLLTAHVLGRGTPPDVAQELLTGSLQQPGFSYEQTWAEVGVMIGGAERRFGRAPVQQPGIITADPGAIPASPFLTVDELLDLPPAEWMVDGYLPTHGMSALFAPPGAFKSFLAVDLALSVAYGLPWHGLATRQRKTLYVVSEGKHGFGRRVRGWQEHRAGGAATDQFMLLPAPVNFLDPGCVDDLIRAIGDHLGGVGFIVLDTLARNFGPGDENSTKDMNAYVAGTTRLAERGCHVLHVHHTGKDSDKGERGSSALRGALDASLKIDREKGSDVATLYVTKQKDGPEARPLRMTFPVCFASHPRTGEVFETRVATLAGEAAVAPVAEAPDTGKLSGLQRELMEHIRLGVGSVTVLTKITGGDKPANIRRALERLAARRLIEEDANGFWFVSEISFAESESNQ